MNRWLKSIWKRTCKFWRKQLDDSFAGGSAYDIGIEEELPDE